MPTAGQRYQDASFLRKDWLDALGLQSPATTADLKATLEAFAKRDPDKNGQPDTIAFSIGRQGQGRIGWGLFTEPFGIPAGATGGTNAPGWRLGPDGKIVSLAVTPEMKAAVGFMREVYAADVLNKDFPTLNQDNVSKEFVGGRSGGYYFNMASGYDLHGAQLRQIVPSAVVVPITPPTAEGFKKATPFRAGVNTVTQLNAKYARDTELAWEVLRVLDFWLDPATEAFVNFGLEGVHHTKQPDGSLKQTEKGTADIQGLRFWSPRHYLRFVDAPYVTLANKEQIKKDTERLAAFAVEDPTWGIYPDLGADDPSRELDDYTSTTLERIVRGEQPLSAFDGFVTEWNRRGGQRLTDALTEQYRKAGR